jgi:carbon storage regulator
MLVLSRKSRESVVIGGSTGFERLLKVTVLGIEGGRVRLGFDVDSDVPVHREEVWQRIAAKAGETGGITTRNAVSREVGGTMCAEGPTSWSL